MGTEIRKEYWNRYWHSKNTSYFLASKSSEVGTDMASDAISVLKIPTSFHYIEVGIVMENISVPFQYLVIRGN